MGVEIRKSKKHIHKQIDNHQEGRGRRTRLLSVKQTSGMRVVETAPFMMIINSLQIMNHTVTKIETVTHFDLISSTDGVRFYAKVMNKNAKKEWNARVAYYAFRSEAERDAWVKDMAGRYQAHADGIQARKIERMNAPNPAQVGDILVSSWGYEQTNIDFYQVTRVTNRGVFIREICGKLTDRSTGNSMAGYKKPIPNAFKKDEIARYALVRDMKDGQYAITDKSYKYTYKTNPNDEHYCSWYA